jgi:site-specific DNA-cytosine methylase
MKVLELFAGTRSIGRAFERKGHEVYSIEWDKNFEDIDWHEDIGNITAQDIIDRFGKPDVIWASPDCTSYSLAAISHHRVKEADGNLRPITEYAKFCDKVNAHVIELIKELNPTYFFIENPRGGLCNMNFMKGIPKHLVTYCQYGYKYMKPTHIFTNYPNPEFKHCKNGDSCHESAPRGSRTGVQGVKGSKDRSRIPDALCDYVVELCENGITIQSD